MRYLKLSLLLCLLTAVSLLAMLPSLPTINTQGRDSGIFAYTALVISEGGVPYRDALDNKLPLLYYGNALAFKLFGANRWSIWGMEALFVIATAFIFYRLLERILGENRYRVPLALGGTVTFILQSRHPGLVGDGNFTESYALLFQVLGFWAGYEFLRTPNWRWGFLLGLAAGLAFLCKQNTVGLALTFVPAVLLVNHPVWHAKGRWRWLGSMIIGGLLVPGILTVYLAAHDALDDTWDAAFAFPEALHEWVSIKEKPDGDSLLDTIENSLTSVTFETVTLPVAVFFLVGVPLAAYDGFKRRGSPTDRAMQFWAVSTFVVDLVLANLTNREYFHYYLTPLPPLIISLVYFLRMLFELEQPYRWLLRGGMILYLSLLGLSAITAMQEHIEKMDRRLDDPVRIAPIAQFIMENTEPDDTVLIWGAYSSLNFQSKRHSPTQYHYAYPLIVPGYTTEAMITDFVDDLERNQPVMIIDTTRNDGDRIPSIGEADREEWLADGGRPDTADLSRFFDFVLDHCHVSVHNSRVTVYRCRYN